MWIMSQNKNRLIDAKDIDYDYDERQIREKTGKTIKERGFKVSETKVVDTVEEHWILANGVRVALYSTEKKALKVLDMIKMCINGEIALDPKLRGKFRNTDIGTFTAIGFVREMQRQVFQMPQDDEVEEDE